MHISSKDQNLDGLLDILRNAGCRKFQGTRQAALAPIAQDAINSWNTFIPATLLSLLNSVG
jgi:hypothetical protein